MTQARQIGDVIFTGAFEGVVNQSEIACSTMPSQAEPDAVGAKRGISPE